MKREKLSRQQSEEIILNRDQAREYYFRKFFDLSDPDRSDLYHISINTSEVSLEFGVDLIVSALDALKDGRIIGPVGA